jgi:hypothetical protein
MRQESVFVSYPRGALWVGIGRQVGRSGRGTRVQDAGSVIPDVGKSPPRGGESGEPCMWSSFCMYCSHRDLRMNREVENLHQHCHTTDVLSPNAREEAVEL